MSKIVWHRRKYYSDSETPVKRYYRLPLIVWLCVFVRHQTRMVSLATITKRTWTTGKGEPREAWLLAFTDSSGKRHREQFKTKREADAIRIKSEGAVAGGTFRPEGKDRTVADVVDLHIRALKARHLRDARVTKTYLNTASSELQNYVLALPRTDKEKAVRQRAVPFERGIGHVRLSQIASSTIAGLRDDLLDAGVTVSTVRRVLATLARAFDAAAEKNWLTYNPARGIKTVGSRKDEEKDVIPPTPTEMKTLRDAVDDPVMRVRLLFAAASGLRASEQWALQWRHVLVDPAEIKVEQRLDIFGIIDTTKSKAGRRNVPVGRSIIEMLLAHKATLEKSGANDLVFPDSKGGHVRHGNFLKRDFNPLVEKAELPAITWHSLRHYAVSIWIAGGLPPKTIQTWAGHATLAITMDVYGHLFPSEEHSIVVDALANELLT